MKLRQKIKRFRLKKIYILWLIILLLILGIAAYWTTNYIISEADYYIRLGYTNVQTMSEKPYDYYAIKGRLNMKVSETVAVKESSDDIKTGTRSDSEQEKDYFYVTLNFRFKPDSDKVFQRTHTVESSFGEGYTIEYRTYLNNGATLSDLEEDVLDKILHQLHNGNVSDFVSQTTSSILLKEIQLIRYNHRYIVVCGNDIYEMNYLNELHKIFTLPDNRSLDYILYKNTTVSLL